MQQGQNQNWLPLESNPEVINPLMQKMGLKTQLFSFQEMLSTEEWALDMIPKPVLGVLFLYECTPVQTQHAHQQQATLQPQQVPQDIFFMKQFAQNACGTIGLFHIVLNAIKEHPNIIESNSYLDNFRGQGLEKSAQERGNLFKESKDLLQQHKSASEGGQSAVKTQCDSHFISFIQFNGRLYEMDGFKKCPVDHGACSEEELAVKASQIIQQFMNRDPDNIQFSMLVLAKTPEE